MGAQLTYLKKPIAVKEVVDGHVLHRARFGACAMQGWRRGMEDAHLAVPDLTGDGHFSLFGVFDGHGGCGVARFAERHLPEILVATEAFKRQDYGAALTAAFLELDERLLMPAGREELRELDAPGGVAGRVPMLVSRKQWSQYGKGPGAHKAAVRAATEDLDKKAEAADDEEVLIDPGALREITPEGQGSTAVVALIVWGAEAASGSGEARLIVANAGDSRCIVGRSGQELEIEAFAMSEDHKPELPGEAARITAGGGNVVVMPGGARVNGDLNLSRALGDFRHKQQQNVAPEKQVVTCNPEIRECTLGSERRLMVIGCDGIWERNTNQKLVERLHSRLSEAPASSKPLLSTLGAEVCDSSLCKSMNFTENPTFDGSGCDNMTILILEFDKLSGDTDSPAQTAQSEAVSPIHMSSFVAEILAAAGEADATEQLPAAALAATEPLVEAVAATDLVAGQPAEKKRRLET